MRKCLYIMFLLVVFGLTGCNGEESVDDIIIASAICEVTHGHIHYVSTFVAPFFMRDDDVYYKTIIVQSYTVLYEYHDVTYFTIDPQVIIDGELPSDSMRPYMPNDVNLYVGGRMHRIRNCVDVIVYYEGLTYNENLIDRIRRVISINNWGQASSTPVRGDAYE